jgi:hypothetical protein
MFISPRQAVPLNIHKYNRQADLYMYICTVGKLFLCMHICTVGKLFLYMHICTVGKLFLCMHICTVGKLFLCMHICTVGKLFLCMHICTVGKLTLRPYSSVYEDLQALGDGGGGCDSDGGGGVGTGDAADAAIAAAAAAVSDAADSDAANAASNKVWLCPSTSSLALHMAIPGSMVSILHTPVAVHPSGYSQPYSSVIERGHFVFHSFIGVLFVSDPC